jgi:hypothetical protein
MLFSVYIYFTPTLSCAIWATSFLWVFAFRPHPHGGIWGISSGDEASSARDASFNGSWTENSETSIGRCSSPEERKIWLKVVLYLLRLPLHLEHPRLPGYVTLLFNLFIFPSLVPCTFLIRYKLLFLVFAELIASLTNAQIEYLRECINPCYFY